MNVMQVINNAAGLILSQPLPPIPQSSGPNFGSFLLNAGFAILWAIVAAIIFTIVIAVGLRIYNVLTPGVDEMKELAQGNTAVGITMAAFILAISSVVSAVLLK